MIVKALVLEKIHKPLHYKEIELPSNTEYETVDLMAASLNRRDYWITKGLYPGITLPTILGSDGVGTWNNKEVVFNPNVNWGSDLLLPARDYRILGLKDFGTFAQKIRIPRDRIHEKPSHLSTTEAAALPLAGLTAFRALFTKGQLKSTDTLLITGVGGGVALMLCQFALAIGAKVFVTSGSSKKIEKAKAIGVSSGALYTSDNWAAQLKDESGGFDLVVDGAGGPGFSKLLRLSKLGGRIVTYGGTGGVIDHIVPAHIFLKQISILGSTMGSDIEFEEMLAFVTEHKIVPIVDSVFPLENGAQALQKMAKSKQFGKIVLKVN